MVKFMCWGNEIPVIVRPFKPFFRESAPIVMFGLVKELIEKANNCQIIARVGVGLDNIDQDAAREKNIRVINAVEGAITAVAELVIG